MTYKEIPGYEGIYFIDSLGNVMNKNKLLKPFKDKDGYLKVRLYKNGYKNYFIHRLVAIAFISNEQNLPCINHINEIKNDNRKENLEWCTVKYNNRYSKKHNKLDDSKAKDIRDKYSLGKTSHYKIAKEYGVSPNAIMQVLKNKSYVSI